MSSYNTLAQFYDFLTENVDYKVRSEYISNFFSEYGNGGKNVLDLACGTGTISKLLCDRGYKVKGMDISDEMLIVAQEKSQNNVAFFKGDISDFSLPDKFDYCICLLDSLNHLENIDAVKSCFECVYHSLNENGLFIFDVNTVYKHRYVLGDNTFVFDEEDFFLSWDNEYCDENRVRILLDFFVFNGKNYDRFSEEFYEKAYELSELKSILNGFEILAVYDELTTDSPSEDSQRVYFICKKI
ncbi:MAG: class I SAM-dependent methyltransferase [Eubacterium sp.]|nr:class I SAM-dependent methyltransferase [Eubacterium sp.]